MTTELFRVSSIAPEYHDRKDVCFHWFIEDRHGKPTVPYAEAVRGYEPGDPYAESFVEELFTEDEARQLVAWLDATHPTGTQHIEAVDLPAGRNMAGYGANAVGGTTDFYMLSETPGDDLPFKVWGFFDLRFCEPMPGHEHEDLDEMQSAKILGDPEKIQ